MFSFLKFEPLFSIGVYIYCTSSSRRYFCSTISTIRLLNKSTYTCLFDEQMLAGLAEKELKKSWRDMGRKTVCGQVLAGPAGTVFLCPVGLWCGLVIDMNFRPSGHRRPVDYSRSADLTYLD